MKSTKTMLVAALAVGALIACNASLLAQDAPKTPPAGEQGSGMRGGRPDLAKALDLTDEQKPKVEAIQKSTSEKLKAVREENAAQMKAVLTPEQFAKFEKMGQGMRGNRPPGGAPGAGGDRPAPPAGGKPPKD